jgi:type I restriction enzyme S subunit
MALPGFKTTTTTQGNVLEAAIYLLFSRLEQIYPMKRLDEVATISSGGTPSRQISSFYGGDIPWAKIGDITSAGKWISKTEETITEIALEQSAAKLFPAGTVFFSMYGSIGKTSIANRSIATNQAILGLMPSNGVPSEYLYYALINARVRLFSQSKGTSQKNINGGMVKDFKIPLPPISEQEKIIKYLSLVEEGKSTESIRHTTNYLEETCRVVERVEALAIRIAKAQSLREEINEETELLLAAELKKLRYELLGSKFTKNKLGDITQVTAGGTPSRDNPSYWKGKIPWIKTGELVDGDIYSSGEHITEEGMKNSSAKLFPKKTILIALYGQGQTRGRTGRLMIEATTNQACCAILPTPDLLEPRFTQYWLRSLYYEMREKSHGGAQPNWNGAMIKNIEITIPPLDEQRRIVAYLDSVQARLASLRELQSATGEELDALLPSVLDRAFKGEL